MRPLTSNEKQPNFDLVSTSFSMSQLQEDEAKQPGITT